jgi:TRAP-type C4-dicarboxylate transport system substrate-binding protein
MSRLLLLAGLIALSACQELAGPTVIKLAHGLDLAHPVHQSMAFMAERAAEMSAGGCSSRFTPANSWAPSGNAWSCSKSAAWA